MESKEDSISKQNIAWFKETKQKGIQLRKNPPVYEFLSVKNYHDWIRRQGFPMSDETTIDFKKCLEENRPLEGIFFQNWININEYPTFSNFQFSVIHKKDEHGVIEAIEDVSQNEFKAEPNHFQFVVSLAFLNTKDILDLKYRNACLRISQQLNLKLKN